MQQQHHERSMSRLWEEHKGEWKLRPLDLDLADKNRVLMDERQRVHDEAQEMFDKASKLNQANSEAAGLNARRPH